MVFKVCFDLAIHGFLGLSLFRMVTTTTTIWISISCVYLFLTKIPQMNLSIIDTCCQLVDIGQILEALNEIVNEPWRVLSSICDIFFALLVTSDLLLFTSTWALCRSCVDVWLILGVA